MLDLITVALLVLFFILGWSRGLLLSVFTLIAVIAGVLCSLKLSGTLAIWLLERGWVTSGWSQLISYILLFTAVVVLVRLLAKAFASTLRIFGLEWLNKLAGGLAYVFMAAVVWSSLLWIGNQMHLLTPETIVGSRTYDYLKELAPIVSAQAGRLLPFAKDIFQELQYFFDKVNQYLPEYVGSH